MGVHQLVPSFLHAYSHSKYFIQRSGRQNSNSIFTTTCVSFSLEEDKKTPHDVFTGDLQMYLHSGYLLWVRPSRAEIKNGVRCVPIHTVLPQKGNGCYLQSAAARFPREQKNTNALLPRATNHYANLQLWGRSGACEERFGSDYEKQTHCCPTSSFRGGTAEERLCCWRRHSFSRSGSSVNSSDLYWLVFMSVGFLWYATLHRFRQRGSPKLEVRRHLSCHSHTTHPRNARAAAPYRLAIAEETLVSCGGGRPPCPRWT